MNKLLLAIAFIALAGCGETRSLPPGEEATRAFDVDTPVYDAPITIVLDQAVLACRNAFHRVGDVDREANTISLKTYNFWAGNVRLDIKLTETEDGKVAVFTDCRGFGFNGSVGRHHTTNTIRLFLDALNDQMQLAYDQQQATNP